MLAYRHAFHAGNHGDVLKHATLVAVLRYMTQKDAPFTFFDSHAGAGGYALDGQYAQKRAEHEQGVSALLANKATLPELLFDYIDCVKTFNGGAAVTQYPGSPAFASMLLRTDDAMRLHELHPTDERILRGYLGKRALTHITMADGFAGFARDLPPPSRRGVVLIDPSYELKTDYVKTLGALREGIKRFATGSFIVWYPQLQTVESVQLPKRLMTAANEAPKGWVHASLTVNRTAPSGFGLMGSGVVVVNPPFTLAAQLRECLPLLAEWLGHEGQGKFVVQEGRGTKPSA